MTPAAVLTLPKTRVGSGWSGMVMPHLPQQRIHSSCFQYRHLFKFLGVSPGGCQIRSQSILASSWPSLTRPKRVAQSAVKLSPAFRFNNSRPSFSTLSHHDQRCVDSSETASQVRQLMRRVPYPVAIVTATDSEAGPDAWRGATVSSFNTVTLEPSPTVSFNIKQVSSTLDAIKASGRFRVHLLRESKQASELAQRFTRGNASAPFGDTAATIKSQDLQRDIIEPPRLQAVMPDSESNSVSFDLLCELMDDKFVEIGDHVVVFGVVDDAGEHPSHLSNIMETNTESCLVYAHGQYQRIQTMDKGSGD